MVQATGSEDAMFELAFDACLKHQHPVPQQDRKRWSFPCSIPRAAKSIQASSYRTARDIATGAALGRRRPSWDKSRWRV